MFFGFSKMFTFRIYEQIRFVYKKRTFVWTKLKQREMVTELINIHLSDDLTGVKRCIASADAIPSFMHYYVWNRNRSRRVFKVYCMWKTCSHTYRVYSFIHSFTYIDWIRCLIFIFDGIRMIIIFIYSIPETYTFSRFSKISVLFK